MSMFKKDYLFFSWIPPRAPYSMLGHVTTITHKNNLVLSNIDPGAGGTSAKKVKIGNLPNIFDDDCRW